jgi:hypothetical protein
MKSKLRKRKSQDDVSELLIAHAADFEWAQLDSYKAEINKYPPTSPYVKYLLRYDSFSKRAEAEAEFLEKKICLAMDLDDLEDRAINGDITSLRTLAFLAAETTKRLNKYADEHSEYVANVAEGMPSWPILVTETSARDINVIRVLKSIRLDAARTLGVLGSKVGSEPVEAKEWALKLLQAIRAARSLQGIRELEQTSWGYSKIPVDSLMLFINPLKSDTKCDAERKAVLESCKNLAPLSVETAPNWWDLGRMMLRNAMEHSPNQFKALYRVYGRNETIQDLAKRDAKISGVVKSEAVEEVRKSFFRLLKATPKVKNKG